jgi:hypothetical protein
LKTEDHILIKIKQAKPGTLFFPEQFRKFGENTAIRKAFQRLTESGKIIRVTQGMYVIPKESLLFGKALPGAEDVAAAIAKRDRARIVPTGVQALNLLGLSTQVPVKVVYLTDGAARTVKVGKQTIKFKKTTPKNLAAKGPISGLVIQALKTIGKGKATEDELNIIILHLKREKREYILHDLELAPVWIAEIMRIVVTSEK